VEYLVTVDHKGMAVHLARSDEGFKKCCISSAVAGTDDDMLGMFYVLSV